MQCPEIEGSHRFIPKCVNNDSIDIIHGLVIHVLITSFTDKDQSKGGQTEVFHGSQTEVCLRSRVHIHSFAGCIGLQNECRAQRVPQCIVQ